MRSPRKPGSADYVLDPEGRLRAAITEARKDGLPTNELERANDALSALVLQQNLTDLWAAAASEDEELLREAIAERSFSQSCMCGGKPR